MVAGEEPLVGREHHLPTLALVGLGVLAGDAAGESPQPLLGGLRRKPRLQAAEGVEHPAVPGHTGEVPADRHPEVHAAGQEPVRRQDAEARGHHSHHRVVLAVQGELSPHGPLGATEETQGGGVGEHGDLRPAGLVLSRQEGAAGERRHPQQAEQRGRTRHRLQGLGVPGAGGREISGPQQGELFEDPSFGGEVQILGAGEPELLVVETADLAPDQHQRGGIAIRQRRQQHGADHRRQRREGPDAEHQGEEGRDALGAAPGERAPGALENGAEAPCDHAGAPTSRSPRTSARVATPGSCTRV